MIHTIKNGPEKESKDIPVTEPTPRTNEDNDKSDPRKKTPKTNGGNLKVGAAE